MNPRQIAILAIGLFASATAACRREAPAGTTGPARFTEEETREILKLSPLPGAPPSPSNSVADNRDAAHLGQTLFFDARLSANGEVSCATCHDPEHGFSDGKPLSEGLETTDRHSMALWNVAHQRWFFWDGRADSLWAQSLQPLHSEREMGASTKDLLRIVRNDPGLTAAYEAVFGSMDGIETPGGLSLDRFASNLGKSIEAYQRRIVSADSPFDRFVADLRSAGAATPNAPFFDDPARRGLRLFAGRGRCVLCHAGPNFSDGEFHNIGLPKRPGQPPDQGRFLGIRKVQADRFNGLGEFSDAPDPETNIKLRYLAVKLNHLGEFKTPTLRHVAATAPYMHDGRFATLRDVIDFYSELPGEPAIGHREETLVPLRLTESEKNDLEAFLRSLTGAPLDPSLMRPPEASATVATARNAGVTASAVRDD